MSLKELTWDNHQKAEATPFMKAVFKKTMPAKLWADLMFQKSSIYNTIENIARHEKQTLDILEIERSILLYLDAKELSGDQLPKMRPITVQYCYYLLGLIGQPDRIMAHLYVWHMGDLFGGQMIKKIMPGPHRNLEFDNPDELKVKIRSKLNVGMADEANVAFEWAIKLMETYTDELDLANAG
jgi:heme oxygenase